MSRFTILHLSDIHFKSEEKSAYRKDVKRKMLDTVNSHLERHEIMPDFVVVTGDIAFSGTEYNEAEIFFKDLKDILHTDTAILPIPGNHDVDRNEIAPDIFHFILLSRT